MKTYMEKAIAKVEKKLERKIKKAFRKNDFSNIFLKKCVAYYDGYNSLTLENKKEIIEKCRSCMDSYKQEILNGVGTIYAQAFTNINNRLRKAKASYEISVGLREEELRPYFYMGDFDEVKTEVHIVMSIEFKSPAELENKAAQA